MERNQRQRQAAYMRKSLFDQPAIQVGCTPSQRSRQSSSSSIGAKKVKKECTQLQECCKAGNFEGYMKAFQDVKQEHVGLRRKLESYLQIAREAICQRN